MTFHEYDFLKSFLPLFPPFLLSTQDLAFVVGGGFSCWLISAMSPNGFESIVSIRKGGVTVV